jgi:hypothetical protein
MPHKHKFFLACDMRAYYIFEVTATSFEAAKRKVAMLALPETSRPTKRRAQRLAMRPRPHFAATRVDIQRHSSYWAEGFVAATNRQPVTACPYKASSKPGRHWLAGYATAEDAA